jgi:hypothetical protein
MKLIENCDAWLRFRCCISFYTAAPENIPANQLESWLAGFEAGQRFTGWKG